jgi:hypothetical protein
MSRFSVMEIWDHYILYTIASMYHLLISEEKYVLGFEGTEHLQAKIIINNQIVEQVNSFNYLRSTTFYLETKDVEFKLHEFLKLVGTIKQTIPRKV